MCPDYYNVRQFDGKKVKPKYKPAKGNTSKIGFGNTGRTKPATKKRVSMVDKKVKRISNKVMKFKTTNPGKAANNTGSGGGNPA